MEREFLNMARYGDKDDLVATIAAGDIDINTKDEYSGNTALHMACANGHLDCVKVLIKAGAKLLLNDSENSPLHWAVQNKHLKVVKCLLKSYPNIDVLQRNEFGRGCVTEAFQAGDTNILAALLEHKSASEEKLAAGTGVDVNQPTEPESEAATTVIQEALLNFSFADESELPKDAPNLIIRELALDFNTAAFKDDADKDSTGVTVWSAALILSRWIINHRNEFQNKSMVELGSGCGVSGVAARCYTEAKRVVLTDYFDHTVDNLKFNVDANCKTYEKGTEVDVRSLDWANTPGDETFDVVFGSDLVYHDKIVPILVETITRLVKPNGVFYHVASEERSSLQEFQEMMEQAGFTCEVQPIVDEDMKRNPLLEHPQSFFDLHFNEMDNAYNMHVFKKAE